MTTPDTPSDHTPSQPLLRDGYRPFFLGAMLFATIVMAVWLIDFLQGAPTPSLFGKGYWHVHEMVYGFGLAFAAGFLLQAARNWTGITPLHPRPLAALALLWLAGRFGHFFPDLLPSGLAAIPDLFFPLLLTSIVAGTLIAGRASHAFALVEVTLIACIAAIFGYWGWTGWEPSLALMSDRLMLYALIALVVVLAGKLIPGFTEKTLGYEIPPGRFDATIENTAIASIYLLMVLLFIMPGGPLPALTAVVAAVANGLRLRAWHFREVWRHPLLWVLQCGYGWVVIGLLLAAAGLLGLLPLSSEMHALGIGGIGVSATGMMSRVILSRREHGDAPDSWVTLAFILINVATAAMVVAPAFEASAFDTVVLIAGLSWVGAFGVLSWRFSPALITA